MPGKIDGKKLNALTDDELRAGITAHIRDHVSRFKGRVYVWDVVNEAVANRDIFDRIGWEEFARAFKTTKATDPQVLTAYNDYLAIQRRVGRENAGWEREKELIRQIIGAGAPLDIIGEQAHLGRNLIPQTEILANLDEIGALGPDIEITEYDLAVTDEKIHGQYTRDFLTACFSHPKVVAFVHWGFWEGRHWRQNERGFLFRRDWSKTPAQLAWEDLVFKQWGTRENGETDAAGAFVTRGFLGDYEIKVTAGQRTKTEKLSLPKTGAKVRIAMD